MKSKKAIIFDVGNTLLKLNFLEIAQIISYKGELDKLKKSEKLILQDVNDYFKNSMKGKNFFNHMFQSLSKYSMLDPQETYDRLRKYDRNKSLWNIPSVNANNVLVHLRELCIELGVISNSDGRVNSLLLQTGLRDYFDFIIDSNVVKVSKPNPNIFQLGIEKLSDNIEEIYYVGDIPHIDCVGALKANLNPILYDPFCQFSEDVEFIEKKYGRKVIVINDLIQILDYIKK